MSEGTLVGGRVTLVFSVFLKSACCNAPLYQWHWFEADAYMNACCECKAILGAPEGWDMELIKGGLLPQRNEILENLTFVDLETGPQSFRTITVY